MTAPLLLACGASEWAEAVAFSVIALAGAGAYAAFRFTGGKHDFERLNDRIAQHSDDER